MFTQRKQKGKRQNIWKQVIYWKYSLCSHQTISIFPLLSALKTQHLKVSNKRRSSPRVQLVDRSVNPHRDLQGLLAASLPHQVDHSSEARAAHVSRASGNTLTDQTHNVTVQLRRQNAQRGQDVVDLFSVPSVTGKKRQEAQLKRAEAFRCTMHFIWIIFSVFIYISHCYILYSVFL